MKGRTIQRNLHLTRTNLENVKDDKQAALVNLDQSKAFGRVHHKYLAALLQSAASNLTWISHPSAVIQVNGKWPRAFALSRSVRQCFLQLPLIYPLVLDPLLHRLRHMACTPALCGITVPGDIHVRVSAYADVVSIFVLCCSDIEVVQKALERYEKVINVDKSSALRLDAWKGSCFWSPLVAPTDPSALLE